ncbi:uncharacterized protein [Eucyclogobius newberryi]|uniref:uncharacterized protein n=1 Tax=Eucyclogobius newberryi TaxID=166745 RepID=UPI003B5CBF1E
MSRATPLQRWRPTQRKLSILFAETESKAAPTWGYVILMLILLLILALCIILFYMRRATRTYTFDLQRPAPGRGEPIGSFEPVHLDDLDFQVHTSGFSKAADANGTLLSTEDKELNGEVSQTTGLQTPDSSPKIEPTQVQLNQDLLNHQGPLNQGPLNQDLLNQDPLNQDPLNQDPLNQDPLNQDPLNQDLRSSPVLFIEESQDEINVNNNNNPSARSSAFVEIDLDEPRSSVQPFNFSASELPRFY